jgi:hypothetical protein
MRCHPWVLSVALVGCPASPADETGTSEAPASTSDQASSGTTAPTTGGESSTGAGESSTGAPPEDGLRIHQLQAMGTHNSYHVSSGDSVKDLDYTHRPLPDQLDSGARQFELDLNFKQPTDPIEVHHLALLDPGTTCPLLKDCLQALRGWSDAHPQHHVLYVMLEFKTPYNAVLGLALLDALEQEIVAVWPRERIVAPDDVQGDAPTLREGLAAGGWPTIEASRGKILLVLHDSGSWRGNYVEAGLAGHLLFPDAFGELELPYAAVHTLNDPTGDAAKITAALDAGHLVRTRADSENVEPFAGDYTRAMAALASAATFISTDYPPPKGEVDYVFEIPDGTPSRCNPRTAPEDCTLAQIEAL